ncbi:MAG: acyltransferase family protein [Ramlibacter sp.]
MFENRALAAVNGALWTLKIEVMFYFSVPLFLLLFKRFNRLAVLAVAYGLSVVYSMVLAQVAVRTGSGLYAELARQLPGQLSYFMAGACLYYYLPQFERRSGAFLLAGVVVLAVNRFVPLLPLEPLALACVVVFFGLSPYLGNFGKHGDFSYGLYILHFPLIQLLLGVQWLQGRPWVFLAMVLVASISGAVAMWYLVERRFLLRSSHYVEASAPNAT